jgi:hypothetical protein
MNSGSLINIDGRVALIKEISISHINTALIRFLSIGKLFIVEDCYKIETIASKESKF